MPVRLPLEDSWNTSLRKLHHNASASLFVVFAPSLPLGVCPLLVSDITGPFTLATSISSKSVVLADHVRRPAMWIRANPEPRYSVRLVNTRTHEDNGFYGKTDLADALTCAAGYQYHEIDPSVVFEVLDRWTGKRYRPNR